MSKTNIGLVDYCKAKLNVPTMYCLGTFGRKLTQSQLDYSASRHSHTMNNYNTIKQGLGRQTFDCVGLIKGYLWEINPDNVQYNVPSGSDQNCSMMYNASTEKGQLSSMPDIAGMLVFTADLGHVGVYIGKDSNGNRQYIECTPAWSKWGVCQSNDSIRKWTYWSKYRLIEYVGNPAPQPDPQPTPQGDWIQYTIKSGDTLSGIAGRYNTSWQTIYERNKGVIGSNPNLIHAGTVIFVPNAQTSQPVTYTVQRGDSLSSIAGRFNTTWQKIYEKNKGVIGGNPNLIYAGQVLKI